MTTDTGASEVLGSGRADDSDVAPASTRPWPYRPAILVVMVLIAFGAGALVAHVRDDRQAAERAGSELIVTLVLDADQSTPAAGAVPGATAVAAVVSITNFGDRPLTDVSLSADQPSFRLTTRRPDTGDGSWVLQAHARSYLNADLMIGCDFTDLDQAIHVEVTATTSDGVRRTTSVIMPISGSIPNLFSNSRC